MSATTPTVTVRPDETALVDDISANLARCLLADQVKLKPRLKRLRRQLRELEPGGAIPAALGAQIQRIRGQYRRSVEVCERRASLNPKLSFAEGLPISQHREQLMAMLEHHQVLIVSGETGSGKSTQLPKICLQLGRGISGRIGHTQPRRIAARAIAERIADETATAAGNLVGHSVRFDQQVGSQTRLKIMTDGILLNEIHADPWLYQYDTLIIDEVHERSLNIDVLLAYLKQVLARRPDMRLIVTSATLDVEAFEAFYPGCAVYQIPGRSYPVTLEYRPPEDDNDDAADIQSAILRAVNELDQHDAGDVLVFLPGEREIRETHKVLARAKLPNTEIIELYARLGTVRQAKIFRPGSERRIILATNIAETSLTVPRVRHVIDIGLARISRYSPRRKLQQLPIEKIAQANANQRAGRCGREAPGICIRLYSEADLLARRQAVEPEILRTNLAGVILRLKALGRTEIEDFPFAERPAERLLKDGYSVLQEIGALDAERALTPIGKRLNRLPLDPRLARVLLAAAELGCLAEALIITAALSIADPRERPHELREHADKAHQEFADKRSDFLWFVNAWPTVCELAQLPFKRRLRRCRRLFVSAVRVQEWHQLHDFLSKRMRADGHQLNPDPAGYKSIHSALIAGFPSLVGEWQGDHYLGCRNLAFSTHPSSILHRRQAKWVLVGDIVETGKPYARLAARIDPHWIQGVAEHLIKRNYEVPFFDLHRGEARVTEIQRLFGLVLSASKLVALEGIDPQAARKLFIDVALIDGELSPCPDFLRDNLTLISRIGDLEARARRRDLIAPQDQLYAFYDARIPAHICTRRALLRWIRSAADADAELYMDEADATSEQLLSVPEYLFPDFLSIAGSDCPLRYQFAPAEEDDGVTVEIPLALLSVVKPNHLDRLVPGMLSEKVESLLRSLPKQWRRQFSPAREFAMAAVEACHEREGLLPEVLAEVLSSMAGLEVPSTLFDSTDLAPHLNMRVEVVDANREIVAHGRDLGGLLEQLNASARGARDSLAQNFDQRSTLSWSFGCLPARVVNHYGTHEIAAIPSLYDEHDAVSIKLFEDPDIAAREHRRGLIRMLMLNVAPEVRRFERKSPRASDAALYAGMFGHRRSPIAELAAEIAESCIALGQRIDCEEGFATSLAEFRVELGVQLPQSQRRLLELFDRGAVIRRSLDELADEIPAASRTDISSQLTSLLGPGSLQLVPSSSGLRYEHYLNGVARRIERIRGNPGKDLQKLATLEPLWRAYLALGETAPEHRGEVVALKVLLEEWRLSIFAPELGVASKVTQAQITEALAELKRAVTSDG